MQRQLAGLMATVVIFVAMPCRANDAGDGKLYVDSGGSELAFSVMLPPRWRADAALDGKPMVGLRPLLAVKDTPDYNVLMYVVALPPVKYGQDKNNFELKRPLAPDVEALQKDLPEKYRLSTDALGDNVIHAYSKGHNVRLLQNSPQALVYSTYMYDPKKGAWGVATLIVSGHAKPHYADYIKDLKTIAYSFAFLR